MNEPTRQAYSVVLRIVVGLAIGFAGAMLIVEAARAQAPASISECEIACAVIHSDGRCPTAERCARERKAADTIDLSDAAVDARDLTTTLEAPVVIGQEQSVPVIRVGEIEIARYLMLCPAEGQASEMWGGALTGSTPSLHEIHDQPPDSKCVVYDLSLCEPTMTLVTPAEKPYVPKAKR